MSDPIREFGGIKYVCLDYHDQELSNEHNLRVALEVEVAKHELNRGMTLARLSELEAELKKKDWHIEELKKFSNQAHDEIKRLYEVKSSLESQVDRLTKALEQIADMKAIYPGDVLGVITLAKAALANRDEK